MRRAFLACLMLALLLPAPAPAQEKDIASGNVVAAPKRPFRIAVLGDSLADGLWGGLYRGHIRQKDRIVIERFAVNSAGFTAYNFEAQLAKALEKGPIDLVVFQVGANDRQRVFAVGNSKEWAVFKTSKWHTLYRQNIQQFLALLQEKKIPIAWVGLPIMRKDDANEDARMMNGIYRSAIGEIGGVFIDIWSLSANKDQEYDPYFEDEGGRKKRFRADDGIHFTDAGYEYLTRQVLKAMREKMPDLRLWQAE